MLRRLLVLTPVLLGLSSFSGFQTAETQTADVQPAEVEVEPQGEANAPVSILVTERSTGKPVPGARLRLLAEEQVSQVDLGRAGLLDQDVWARVAHFGSDLVAGDDGKVEGPGWGSGFLTIQAVHAGSYELRRLRDSPPEGVTMKLRERGSRFVRFFDAERTPLTEGRIAVRSEVQGGFLDLTSAPVRPELGGVELVYLERFVKNAEAGEPLRIVQAGHFPEVPGLRLDPAKLPEAPFEITGLPVGSVELSLVYPSGEPVPSLVEVEVRCTSSQTASPPVIYRTDNGRLRIDHVGLEAPLEISARRPGGANAGRLELNGPENAGGLVEASFEFEEQDVLIFGRLEGLDGLPMYRTLLTCKLVARNVFGQREFETEVVTEPDGGFFLLVPLQARIPVQRVVVDLLLTDPNDGSVRASASWMYESGGSESGDGSDELDTGAFDVGTLRLAAPAE